VSIGPGVRAVGRVIAEAEGRHDRVDGSVIVIPAVVAIRRRIVVIPRIVESMQGLAEPAGLSRVRSGSSNANRRHSEQGGCDEGSHSLLLWLSRARPRP